MILIATTTFSDGLPHTRSTFKPLKPPKPRAPNPQVLRPQLSSFRALKLSIIPLPFVDYLLPWQEKVYYYHYEVVS